ncbi:MAG: YdiY family protein [Moraxellaceae bacterium]
MMRAVPGLLLAATAFTAHGQEAAPFSGTAEAAYLKSSGSSDKETFKGRVAVKYIAGAWEHEGAAEGLNEATDDVRTRERYLVQGKTSRRFTDRDYLFLRVQAETDKQSSYDYQAFAAVGYGRDVIKTDTMKLALEIGAGGRHNQGKGGDDTENEALGNATLNYEWKFRPDARFFEQAAVETGEKSTVVRSRTGVEFDLTQVLKLAVTYDYKRDDGPADLEDTLTAVGLNYKF